MVARSGMQALGFGIGVGRPALERPLVRGANARLAFRDICLEVDAAVAGRIRSARVGEKELLASRGTHAANYGSTFWTSPQNGEYGWGWPPPAPIDSAPFELFETEQGFEVRGPVVDASGPAALGALGLTKRFSASPERGVIHIEYELRNEGVATRRVAPWEITRVGPGGLSFFAAAAEPFGDLPLRTRHEFGCHWFRHTGDAPPHGKLFADGCGWLAHVTPERALLVKTFPDIEPREFAPGEAEIELYSSPQEPPSSAYVELENQGPFWEIAAGSSQRWQVSWYLRELPATVPADPSAALVEFIQHTIK